MDPVGFLMDNPMWATLIALVPVFFLIGIALSSTAMTCTQYDNEAKCTGEQPKQLMLSGNAFLLISAIVAGLAAVYPMASEGLGKLPVVGNFVGKRKYGSGW